MTPFEEPGDTSVIRSALSVLLSLRSLAGTVVELAAVEARVASHAAIAMLAMGIAIAFCAISAWLLLCAAAAVWLATSLALGWILALIVIAVLNVIAVVALALAVRHLSRRLTFKITRRVFAMEATHATGSATSTTGAAGRGRQTPAEAGL